MDAKGRRKHELSAARLVHYPDDDTLEFERPHLVQYTPGEPPLHTIADRGYSTADSKTILMRGNVRVTRGAHGGKPGGEIETGEMQVLLE
jgi:lipopolysaccharide export system protein LptC